MGYLHDAGQKKASSSSSSTYIYEPCYNTNGLDLRVYAIRLRNTNSKPKKVDHEFEFDERDYYIY